MKKNIILKILKYFLFLFPLFIIYLIRPFILIRFQRLNTEILGTFAEATEIYLSKKKKIKSQSVDFFCFGSTCNTQLAKMINKKVKILPLSFLEPIIILNRFLSRYFKFFKIHEIRLRIRDTEDLFSEYSPNLKFTNDEIEFGRSILQKMGLDNNSKFICFMIRDGEYKNKSNLIDLNFSYHEYRNFDSDNFIEAAEKIAEKGYFVIRMGKYTKKKFVSNNKKVIDYSNSEFRSDFMDIFLSAHCELCFSTGTGLDTIPMIFKKPIAAIITPLGYIQTFNDKYISITKHHYFNGRKLKAKEIFERELGFLLDSKHFKEKGVTLKEPSIDEITEFALEALDRFVIKKIDNADDFQNEFRLKFKEYLNYSKENDQYYNETHKNGNILHPEIIKGFFGSNYSFKNNFFD